MAYRYVVCNGVSSRPLGSCPKCNRPCHSKCMGKKKELPCDLCRSEERKSASNEDLQSVNQRCTRTRISDNKKQTPTTITRPDKQKSMQVSSELTPTLPSRRKLTGPMSTPLQRKAPPAAGMRTSLLGANAKSGGQVAGAQGPGSTANGAGRANHSQTQEPAPIDDV